jgi:hypothetical protein
MVFCVSFKKSGVRDKKEGGFSCGEKTARLVKAFYQRKCAKARLACAILCMSSRFLIALP